MPYQNLENHIFSLVNQIFPNNKDKFKRDYALDLVNFILKTVNVNNVEFYVTNVPDLRVRINGGNIFFALRRSFDDRLFANKSELPTFNLKRKS
jgi:hypothetical protein